MLNAYPNPRRLFRQMIQERRHYPKGSMDWDYRTRAAVKYLKLCKGETFHD